MAGDLVLVLVLASSDNNGPAAEFELIVLFIDTIENLQPSMFSNVKTMDLPVKRRSNLQVSASEQSLSK